VPLPLTTSIYIPKATNNSSLRYAEREEYLKGKRKIFFPLCAGRELAIEILQFVKFLL